MSEIEVNSDRYSDTPTPSSNRPILEKRNSINRPILEKFTSDNFQFVMSLRMRKPTIWSPTRSNTNRSVQSLKQARGLKFRVLEEEGLNYPCSENLSENKGADQLRSYCEADLRLCFRICRLLVFRCGGSFKSGYHLSLYSFREANEHYLSKLYSLKFRIKKRKPRAAQQRHRSYACVLCIRTYMYNYMYISIRKYVSQLCYSAIVFNKFSKY